jgi:uncharacterized protein involved in type VI secretion and phage assembly
MSIADFLTIDKTNLTRIFGVIPAIVTNNQDPENLGRVKVKFQHITGEDESNWARVVTFMAGQDRGAVFIPEVDDEVLVAFEQGNVVTPYVIGSLHNGSDTPPVANDDGENNIRTIKSRSGHVITLDDTEGEEKIEIVDKTGKNLITIESSSNIVTISSDGDIELIAKKGKFKVEAKEVSITSTASTKIEASSSIDIKASGEANIKGVTVNLN